MSLSFTTTDAEQVLAALHQIVPSGRKPFLARLRHLQRLGFPAGVKPGKGRAVAYSFTGLMQTAVALELIRAGASPARAIKAVSANWGALSFTVFSASLDEGSLINGKPLRGWIWVLRLDALGELAAQGPDNPMRLPIYPTEDVARLLQQEDFGWRVLLFQGTRITKAVIDIVVDHFGLNSRISIQDELRDESDRSEAELETRLAQRDAAAAPKEHS